MLALLLAYPAGAQELRWPPNAYVWGICLDHALVKSRSFSAAGSTRRLEVEFEVENRCSRAVRVIGLQPHTQRGDKIVQGAAIEIAAIGFAPDKLELGVGTVRSFTVDPGRRVTVRGTIRLRRGATVRDVAFVTTRGHGHGVQVGETYVRNIPGDRDVCAHYSDRPCGAYQRRRPPATPASVRGAGGAAECWGLSSRGPGGYGVLAARPSTLVRSWIRTTSSARY